VPSLELMATKGGNARARLLSKTLDEAIGQYLEDSRYPSSKVNEIDNRGSTYYSEESCPRRFSTVVPSQALTLMNDKSVLDWSRSFAGRVLSDTGLTREQQINRAYRIAFGRAPQPDEIAAVSDFLTRQAALVSGRMTRNEPVLVPDQIPTGTEPSFAAAFVDFCHALMSSNEFLYIN
jgi:hypothetical protein